MHSAMWSLIASLASPDIGPVARTVAAQHGATWQNISSSDSVPSVVNGLLIVVVLQVLPPPAVLVVGHQRPSGPGPERDADEAAAVGLLEVNLPVLEQRGEDRSVHGRVLGLGEV